MKLQIKYFVYCSREIVHKKEFAQQLGMKESQLCKILSGNTNLALKTIVKIETAPHEVIVQVERGDI